MVRRKLLSFIYVVISSFTKENSVQSQWNGGLIDYGSFFVPYTQQGPGSNQYVPLQNQPTSNPIAPYPYPPAPIPPPPIPPPPGPSPPNYPNIISNTPTISYQGYDQAMAIKEAHPNQPIIIINNGGNGESGGNTNDGKNGGIDLTELITVFLAAKAGTYKGKGKGGGGAGGDNRGESIEAVPAAPAIPAPYYPPQAYLPTPPIPSNPVKNAEEGSGGGKSSINITIVLPNSDAEVTVEEEKTSGKRSKKKQKKNKLVVKEIVDDDDGED